MKASHLCGTLSTG